LSRCNEIVKANGPAV